MSAPEDMSRRIPDNLGGTETILDDAPIVGSVQLSDGAVAFGPALIALFLFENILPPQFKIIGFFFFGVMVLAGMGLLLAKPKYLTLNQWISDIRRFRNEPSHYRKALPSGKGGDDTSGEIETIEVNSEQDTRSKINLERIYPQHGAIERPDDTLVGMLRIRGLNLDSASDNEMRQYISRFDDFINRQLREDVQLYMPMRQYDPTKQIDMYEDRLENSRLFQNDPLLQEYINDRISFISALSMGSYIRRYYLVCQVPRGEVLTEEAQAAETRRIIERLFGPFGEALAAIYVAVKGGSLTMMNDQDIKQRQLEKLDERRNELAGQVEGRVGCSTEVLDADEVGVLLKEFWEGVHVNEDEKDGFIRKNPYVKGEADKERIENADEVEFDDNDFLDDEGDY